MSSVAGWWRCGTATEANDQAPRLTKTVGDVRKFGFDLGDLAEIIDGQTITAATISSPDVTVSGQVIESYRVVATLSGGTASATATVTLSATLSGGGTISRTGSLVIV